MRPHPGFCAAINGSAVQLLHLKEDRGSYAIWVARQIFVANAKEIEVTIKAGELLRPIHG